jgi:hypothetical protein
MKQTAVEWLVEKLNQCEPMYSGIQSNEHKKHLEKLVQQSKEIEKEQIIYAHISGVQLISIKTRYHYNDALEYYNKTFKNETK